MTPRPTLTPRLVVRDADAAIAYYVRTIGARHNVRQFPRIEGNLPTVLAETKALLDTLIHKPAQLRDMHFVDVPEYPTFAWEEAIVNAIAHRDYEREGNSIEVWLYDDRLEVWSPGGVPPEVSLDDLRSGRPVHVPRNPRIARVLADLGSMQDAGEGIPRMFEEMEEAFLSVPEIDVAAGGFRVVLRKAPILESHHAQLLGENAHVDTEEFRRMILHRLEVVERLLERLRMRRAIA